MDINLKVKKNLQIRAFYLFFIIASIQLGVGIIGAPKLIYLESLQDSWISILIAFIYIVAVVITMFFILNQYENADIYGIQVDIFGKWIGKFLGTIYIVHFGIALLSVLITYIEVIRVYIFPMMSNFVMGFLLLCLVVYGVLGGLRVIVGVCTVFFLLSHWIVFLLIQPSTRMDITHLQPMFVSPISDLLSGAHISAYTFMGFEILFLVYPFIQNKKKAKLPALLATGWTTLFLLLITIITIGYFSYQQIERREWVLLSLIKVQNFTFVERFDYIVVAEWMMIIVPNMLLLMWGITYGMKRLYKVPQKVTLYSVAVIMSFACIYFDEHYRIQSTIDASANYGFWLVYVYPFLLLPIVLIKKKWIKKKEEKSNAK
ncbi:GerAB/ArcD/ProY family transporter [Oceanobacillus bengalensis]|uniref:Spore gernimation protein n=1 Tax=Oceanobacillus bengalensis TaxID=1435466 RepID=A0A494Z823_9BACI|nr:GerAB/ArcD/ProY family transporter [Oceanobacillus bengalensis]RKQ18760.1 spore gernimation protein [Oceanobacillus bengalensis]